MKYGAELSSVQSDFQSERMPQSKSKIHWNNLWNNFGFLPLLLAVPLGLLSPLLLSLTLSKQIESIQLARASAGWSSTNGEILEAEVTGFRGSSRDNRVTSYGYRVKYRYTVGNREYAGNRLHFSDHEYFDAEEEAYAALGGLKRGAAVSVYFDPNAAANSTLRRTYKLQTFDIAVCLGIGAVAALLFFWTYRLLTDKTESPASPAPSAALD